MDLDFSALASRVAARADVLGCVILSRDGLVLGAFPPNGERDVTPAWLRFSSVGEPERGFVEFPDELWAYCRLGPYAAFAVGSPRTRAGVLLDYLEQALLVAEDSRELRAAVRRPETVDLNRERFGIVLPVGSRPDSAPQLAAHPTVEARSPRLPPTSQRLSSTRLQHPSTRRRLPLRSPRRSSTCPIQWQALQCLLRPHRKSPCSGRSTHVPLRRRNPRGSGRGSRRHSAPRPSPFRRHRCRSRPNPTSRPATLRISTVLRWPGSLPNSYRTRRSVSKKDGSHHPRHRRTTGETQDQTTWPDPG